MSLGRLLLLAIGLMSLGFGAAYLVSPAGMIELTGGSAPTPAAATDVRATYGGFQLGLGAFLLCCVLDAKRLGAGLLALAWVALAIGLSRLLGVVVDGGLGPTLLFAPVHPSALVFELATGLLAWLALSRLPGAGASPA